MAGRPTVWNDEVERVFLEAIELGLSVASAEEACGIGEGVAEKRLYGRDGEPPDAGFVRAVHEARGKGKLFVAQQARSTESPVRLKYCHRYLALHDGQIEPQKIEHSGAVTLTGLYAALDGVTPP